MGKAELIYEKVRALPDTAQAAVLRTVELWSGSGSSQSSVMNREDGLAREFNDLAEIWRRETSFLSFAQQRAVHPAYQRIIGMGWAAVPLILRELERQPEHWLWALQAITGERPAQNTDTLSKAADVWLHWGRERGLISDAQGGH